LLVLFYFPFIDYYFLGPWKLEIPASLLGGHGMDLEPCVVGKEPSLNGRLDVQGCVTTNGPGRPAGLKECQVREAVLEIRPIADQEE
jgi:hypothetical protein